MSASTNGLTFKYKRLPNGILRPLIRVEVLVPGKKDGVPCEVLVDSGADFCILKAEIGEILGYDITSGEPFSYIGINGASSEGYIHDVRLNVKGRIVDARVVFSHDIPRGGHQVVGQVGFFDHFKINFDYQDGTIVLRSR